MHMSLILMQGWGDEVMKATGTNLCVVLSSAILLSLGPGIVQATIYNEVRLTDSEYDNENPWIGGNKIVWQGWDGSDYEIYCYDIVSGETTQITQNAPYNDMYPRTDGEYIFWSQAEPGADPWDDSFCLYEIGTGETILFIENPSWASWDGAFVAWTAPTATTDRDELFLYDATSGETLQITDDSLWDFSPNVHQGRVVWMSSEDDSLQNKRILVYDSSTGETEEVFSTEETLYGFDFRGNRISWWQETAVEGNWRYGKVYAHDLATGQALVVKDTQTYYYRGAIYPTAGDTGLLWEEGEWVTFDQWETRFLYWDSLTGQTRVISDSRRSDYHIDYDYRHTQGKHVVWPGAAVLNDEIYHHDLATGLTTQVTHDIFTDAHPVVYEGTIVWQGFYLGSGHYEIYLGVPCLDGDGDGYEAASCGGTDCDDSLPDVNPGMSEVPGNGIDDDCNPFTPAYTEPANTIAASYGETSLMGSGVFNSLALLLIPVMGVIFLRVFRRRR